MYRKLTEQEVSDLYWQIRLARDTKGILDFIKDIYGEAYQFVICNDGDYSNLRVEAVEVFDEHLNELLPDFTLPYWRDVDLDEFFVEAQTDEQKRERVYEHLRDVGEYEEAGFNPGDAGEPYFLSSLEGHRFPDLYVREGT